MSVLYDEEIESIIFKEGIGLNYFVLPV